MLEFLVVLVLVAVDGDTVKDTDTGEKYRLLYIDAPEKSQPYGLEAKASLQELLQSKVRIVSKKRDLYQRQLAELWVQADGAELMINELQIARGYAWQYYDKDSNRAYFQQHAKECGLGLWRETNPLPPWEYRKLRKQLQRTAGARWLAR